MSFFRVTEPNVGAVSLSDLGITIAQASSDVVLSDQFTAQDLVRSADLETAIINGDLTVEIDYGTGWSSISAGDYTNRDCLGAFLNIYEITNENNNEDLVDGSEVNSSGPSGNPLHIHDARYYTETELGNSGSSSPGGGLIGLDDTSWSSEFTFDDAQEFVDDLYTWLVGGGGEDDLDDVYDNDADGILNVDGTTKDLDFRSDNANDVVVSRTNGTDIQDMLRADVSADELLLGADAVGGLSKVDVRVKTDLYVDGNVTFVGSITDQTVEHMNVTDAEILLRDGASNGADAKIKVERGSDGNDADLKWDEAADRWKAGIEGSEQTIALLEADDHVTGVWEFGGDDDTEPNFWMTEKDPTSVPSTKLGSTGQIPVAMMEDGLLAVYDKSNSRNKWLSVQREHLIFSGRNNASNKDEYLWSNRVNTMQAGVRLKRKCCLVGLSAQFGASGTADIKIRKNGSTTDLATLSVSAAEGNESNALNLDLDAGDHLQVYLDSSGSNIKTPLVQVELAYRFGA